MSGDTYLDGPTAADGDLRSRFAPVFDSIAAGNVDRERGRTFPHEQVRWLKETGFGALRIPLRDGGLGASLRQTFALLAELAAADANVAHVFRNHLAFVEDRLNAPRSAGNDTWIKRFLSGAFVGGGWTEADNVTLANIVSTVTRRDDHWVVTGAKYYATGSLYADWLDVLGRDDVGELRTALVRADDSGVELVDDWRGFGQRTTASGSARYHQVRAESDDSFPAADRFGYQAHFYQIAMLSVLTGITHAALRDGSALLRQRRRNYPQGLTAVPSDDAQLLQVIGAVSADAFAADAALERSSRTLDDIATARVEGRTGSVHQLVVDAEVAVTQAQLVIIAAALKATTEIFDALGASGVSEEHGLDRHWRNARTLASHNPRVYKARILGDWFVNDKEPVSNLAALGRGGQGN